MIKIITKKTDRTDIESKDFENKVNEFINFLKSNGHKINKIEISHSACTCGNYGVSTVFMCVIDYDEPSSSTFDLV